MSVSAVSNNPQIYQPNQQQQTFRQDFQSLTTALQSGDLASAQQAYATLISDNPQLASSTGGTGNPFQQTIASIGASLKSGDLSGAQNALSTLQQNMKAHHGHHHHHGGGETQSATNTTSTTPTASPLSASSSSLNFLA